MSLSRESRHLTAAQMKRVHYNILREHRPFIYWIKIIFSAPSSNDMTLCIHSIVRRVRTLCVCVSVWVWFSTLVPGALARSPPIRIPIKFIKCIFRSENEKTNKRVEEDDGKIDSNVCDLSSIQLAACVPGTGWANWYWIVIVWVKIQAHFDFQNYYEKQKSRRAAAVFRATNRENRMMAFNRQSQQNRGRQRQHKALDSIAHALQRIAEWYFNFDIQ